MQEAINEGEEKRQEAIDEGKKRLRRRTLFGTVVLVVALLIAGIFGVQAVRAKQQADRAKAELEKVKKYIAPKEQLDELAKNLPDISQKDEINRLLNQSEKIENDIIKIAFRLSIRALIYLYLQKLDKAKESSEMSISLIYQLENSTELKNSPERLQIGFFTHFTNGNLLKIQGKTEPLLENYLDAFELLEGHKLENSNLLISIEIVESFHRELINLLSKKSNKEELKNRVNKSNKKYYLYDLNELLSGQKWEEADKTTWRLMLFIARREQQGWLSVESLEKFPCDTLREIDQSWVKHSKNHFGLSVQKQILESLGFQPTDLPDQLQILEFQLLKKISESPLVGEFTILRMIFRSAHPTGRSLF